jgi:hypothetical protein
VRKKLDIIGRFRKLRHEELHNMYCSTDIVRVTKSRRPRLAGHVGGLRIGDMSNARRILIVNHEEKIPFARPRRRWKDNIKMDLTKI